MKFNKANKQQVKPNKEKNRADLHKLTHTHNYTYCIKE